MGHGTMLFLQWNHHEDGCRVLRVWRAGTWPVQVLSVAALGETGRSRE